MQPAVSTGAGALICQPQQHSQVELQQHWQESSRSSTATSRQSHEQMQQHSGSTHPALSSHGSTTMAQWHSRVAQPHGTAARPH